MSKKKRKLGRPREGVGHTRVSEYPKFYVRVPPNVYRKWVNMYTSSGLTETQMFTKLVELASFWHQGKKKR